MKRIIHLLGSFCVLLAVVACSDDIAEEVYRQEKPQAEDKTSSLTIHLENAEEQEDLILAALSESPFNEQGVSKEIGEADFLLSQPVKGSQVVFDDLMDFYKKTLYFNVYQKTEAGYKPKTHLGNQLQYEVVTGNIEKTIDLAAPPQEVIRKTSIAVTVAPEYSGKDLYLVKESSRSQFETSLKGGQKPQEDLYVAAVTAENNAASFVIDSPKSTETYWIYLSQPEEGLPFLKKSKEIGYDTEENVSLTFDKEVKKQIKVTAIYLMGEEGSQTEEPFNEKEIYLINKTDWETVKQHVENTHGNPEKGTYVEKKNTSKDGVVTFELFCTEAQQEYVIYVPKWNTEYYDNYKIAENVTVTPESDIVTVEMKYPFIPPTSEGSGGINKTVTFTVSVASLPAGFMATGTKAHIVKDASKIKEAATAAMNNQPFEGLTSSNEMLSGPGSITFDAEINTGQRFAVFILGLYYWSGSYIAKEIDASAISGNTYTIELNENDEPQYLF